jgi:cAMP phosphodiesterase
VKFQLLPSTFDDGRTASERQHLTCFIINDAVAIDAGSLAMACSPKQLENVRDIVLTHAHLDHIAGLPLFIDDLFSTLTEPVRIHAAPEVIDVLERDVFNWNVYPRFSELKNSNGAVMEYRPFDGGEEFEIKNLRIRPVKVNHRVPTSGFLIADERSVVALSGDTSTMSEFWTAVNELEKLSVLLVECAFPNELRELADVSAHLTPSTLDEELEKLERDCQIFVINLKPAFRERIIGQLGTIGRKGLQVLQVGKVYDW